MKQEVQVKLYLLCQDVNNDYDTYDSIVVAAINEQRARGIYPGPVNAIWPKNDNFGSWAYTPDQVKVTYLGRAKRGTKEGIICASFNAG